MKHLFQKSLVLIMIVAFTLITISRVVQADASLKSGDRKVKRTILLYDCGADLETDAGLATYNLLQILNSSFSADDDVKFLVMTGGSHKRLIDRKYLVFPDGVALPEDAVVDYNRHDPEASKGTANVTIKAKGDKYKGTITKTFKITKKSNLLEVKEKTASVKFKKLKKKSQKLKVSKVLTFTEKGQRKKTYKLVLVKKGSKKVKNKISIHKTSGQVTVKKGLGKGVYKVKVRVKAAGNDTYEASAVKTVVFKIKIK